MRIRSRTKWKRAWSCQRPCLHWQALNPYELRHSVSSERMHFAQENEKPVQAQMTTGQPKRKQPKLGEAKERRDREQVFDVVNAANTYCLCRTSIYTSLGNPRRRDGGIPLCPFRSFCGVVVVVASPLCLCLCGKGRPLRNRLRLAAGKGCVWYGWNMVHVLAAALPWGLRIAGRRWEDWLALCLSTTTPAWRVLWLQWKRDFDVWAMVGDGGCSGWIDGVPDGMRVDIDIGLPRFNNDITVGEVFIEASSLRDSVDRAETADSRWKHDDVSHPPSARHCRFDDPSQRHDDAYPLVRQHHHQPLPGSPTSERARR